MMFCSSTLFSSLIYVNFYLKNPNSLFINNSAVNNNNRSIITKFYYQYLVLFDNLMIGLQKDIFSPICNMINKYQEQMNMNQKLSEVEKIQIIRAFDGISKNLNLMFDKYIEMTPEITALGQNLHQQIQGNSITLLKITRTFVIQNESTLQSTILDLTFDLHKQRFNLTQFLQAHCPINLNIVSIYMPSANKFQKISNIDFSNDLTVSEILQPTIVLIRFKTRKSMNEISEESALDSINSQSQQKKDRSRQRTIGQAIELVKKWRALSSTETKKLSLSAAAKEIGISKKSLDDYYYQLRLGEYYNFDFQNYLQQKIGILRAYVKQFKPERNQKNKNIRHPKNLKIIKEDISREKKQKASMEVESQEKTKGLERNFDIQLESLNLNSPYFKGQCEEQFFFRNFQFMMDEPGDPFIEASLNFKKKNFQDLADQFVFF